MIVDRTSTSTRSRRWVVAAVASMMLVILVVGSAWASSQGYVSWLGTACTDHGYDPVPSYEELVTEYKMSPYCARRIRGEAWF